MTNISKITFGEQQRFVQTLHGAGFTLEDAQRVIKEPSLASTMFASIQPKVVLQTPIPTDIVARVERQLAYYDEAGFVITEEVRQQILADAAAFVPLSATDRPLVTGFFGYTSGTFNRIWSQVKLDGYDSVRYFERDTPFRFADGMNPKFTQPRLVHFEPNSYQGKSPESALKQAKKDNVQLAGIEVGEMLFVEPEWALEWNGKDHPYPNCSALQLVTDWSDVPYFDRWDDDHQLVLSALWADNADGNWSSPSVKECKN